MSGPEPAALPPVVYTQKCDYCGRIFPSREMSKNHHKKWRCEDCKEINKAKQQLQISKNRIASIAKKLESASDGGTVKSWPKVTEATAELVAEFGGASGYAREVRGVYDALTGEPEKQVPILRLISSMIVASGKQEVAEASLPDNQADLNKHIEHLVMQLALEKSPEDVIALIGPARLKELALLADKIVEGEVVTEDD